MFHSPGSLVLEVHCKIDDSDTLLHMRSCYISDPSWNGCREKANLQISTALLSALGQNLPKKKFRLSDNLSAYLVNLFFESLLEHLVGFVKNDSSDAAEVDVASLDVIKYSSACSNKEVDSASESSCLVINGNTTVDGQSFKLIGMMFQH